MTKEITLKEFKYVLDWFDIRDRKINLGDFSFFYLECRGDIATDWYLCHYRRINKDEKSCKPCGNYYIHDYYHDFNLNDPVDAVIKLGQKLKGYRSLHNNSTFPERLITFLKRVEERKKSLESPT